MSELIFLKKIRLRIKAINGDDAAVLSFDPAKKVLATTDTQVSGVHFLSNAKPADIGWKAIAVNVSDIAAMGGVPKYCLVSIILPKDTTEEFIDGLYDGMIAACKEYETAIVGGNISSGSTVIIDITCLGEATIETILRRNGAKPGDSILVTGTLGGAAAGSWKKIPNARLQESIIIAKSKLATAMIDVSDGLSSDLLHICEASQVSAAIWEEKLPVATGATIEQALNGGEDYELCFTVPEKDAKTISNLVKQKTGTEVSIIGKILPEKQGRNLVLKNGKSTPLEPHGWEH